MGEGLLGATDLRARIRERPFLAAGLGAWLGFAGGPFALGTVKRLLKAGSKLAQPGTGSRFGLPAVLFDSLRGARGRT